MPMALFSKSDPEANLQKALDAERALHAELEARLVAAQKTASDCQIAARRATRALASDAELDKLEQKQISAEHRVANLTSELADAAAQVADYEKQLADAADQRVRKQTVAEIEQIAIRFKTATVNADAALGELAAITEVMVRFLPDARGLAGFSTAAKAELPSPAAILTTLLREYSAAVLAGSAKATLPAPEVALVRTVPRAPPAATRVFLIKNVLWTENGQYRTQQKFTDASLPPDIAARALKLGAAVPVDIYNETQQRQRGLAKHYLPTPADCTSLDDVAAEPEPRATETIQHSAFTVIPRGKPFQVGIAAARNLDNRKE